MIYNGQAVTGQTFFYPYGSATYTQNNYWTVASNGVTMIATIINTNSSTTEPDGTFYPQNMIPGQSVKNSSNQVATFVGFESITLAGKTFINTCHIRGTDYQGNVADGWYAPGYGQIKAIFSSGEIDQYNGDL
jgi:hypothetical protein